MGMVGGDGRQMGRREPWGWQPLGGGGAVNTPGMPHCRLDDAGTGNEGRPQTTLCRTLGGAPGYSAGVGALDTPNEVEGVLL